MRKIDDSNFLLVAMHEYDNTQCTTLEEFESDINRFVNLRRLLSRYANDGYLSERLILNHIITLINLFGISAIELMFFKVEEANWSTLITFLVYLNLMPEAIPEFNIKLSDYTIDSHIMHALKEL